MKNLFLLLILSLVSFQASGQFTNSQKQYLSFDNLLTNPGLENGKYGWTCTSGTFTADTSAKIEGAASGKVVLSSQTLDCSITVSTNATLQSAGALIAQTIKTSVAGVKVCPIVDSVEDTNSCKDYDGSDIPKELSFYPYFGATNIGLKIKTDSAVTGTVYFDGSKIGRRSASIVPDISQAQWYGGITYDQLNCTWAATAVGDFPVDADCTGAVFGKASAPDTRIPAVKLVNAPPGTYMVVARPVASISTTGDCYLTINDNSTGTLASNKYYFMNLAEKRQIDSMVERFTYTSAGDRTFRVQVGGISGSPTCNVIGSPTQSSEIDVYYFPPASTISSSYLPWKIDVNIGGANPSLGTAAVTSYTEITNSTLDMVLNPGSASAQIPCSATNASTGTTCSVGNESVGVYIPSLPEPGEYKVCAEFTHFADAGTGAISSVFQLVETTNSTQTIVQEGNSRIQRSVNSASTIVSQGGKLCGNFLFSSTAARTIRLMYEQAVTGTPGTNVLGADRGATLGQRDIHITVERVTPYIVAGVQNAVTSPVVFGEKPCKFAWGGAAGTLDSPTSCTSTPCTLYLDNCSATSGTITRVSAGDYSVLSVGWRPSTPVACHAQTTGGSLAFPVMTLVTTASGQLTVRARTGPLAGPLADSNILIQCTGQRAN